MSAFETRRRALRELWLGYGMLVAVDWADALAEQAPRCAARFGLELGEPLGGGSLAMVLEAVTASGEPAVLKLNPPLAELAGEPDALAAIGGRGAVRLLDFDPGLGAFVLERAEPGSSLELALPRLEALAVAARVAARTHVELPEGHGFPTADAYLARVAIELPLRHVFAAVALPPEVLDATLVACGRLAAPETGVGLANEDLHLGNVLAGEREPWLLIDPKPHAAEVAFSAGYLVRSGCAGLERDALAEALDVIADGVGASPRRVRDWALLRASVGVYERGAAPDPGADLALAILLSRL